MNKFVGGLVSPLMLALLGGLLALLLVWRGWRRAGMVLALLALGGLWLASTPWLAWTLAMSLETRYPPVPAQASPVADAVLVLEIGNERPYFEAAFPSLEVVWLETSAGEDQVLLITRQALTENP